jgi:riboflavin kinase
MIIRTSDDPPEIDYNELATLKELAKTDALRREIKVSSSRLADELGVSNQTAIRRLDALDEADLVRRQPVADGHYVFIREEGKEVLREEYHEYTRIFEADQAIELEGVVVDGMGEGKHYISVDGYQEQFQEKLGYKPFPGTLNVELGEASIRTRSQLRGLEPIRITGWEGDDRTFGAVYCYPARVEADSTYTGAHLIVPERTHHDEDQVELLAPDELRDALELETNDEVTIHVDRD